MNPLPVRRLLEEAVFLHTQGKLAEAERCYKTVLKSGSTDFNALHLLGVIRVQQGRYDEAVKLIRRALRSNPMSAEAHNNLGAALIGLDRHEEAIVCCRQALEFQQDYAEAHNNIGLALQYLRSYEEALACHQSAIALKPNHVTAHNNAGLAFEALNRFDDAIVSYREAISLKSDYADAHCNLGNALHALCRHDESIVCYQRAIDIAPDHADAHWNRSLARLVLGDFPAGWRDYEWRWRTRAHANAERKLPGRRWLGSEDLTDKRILLYAEQGLGDTIQFARYAPLMAAMGGRITLQVQPSLKPLMESLAGVEAVIPSGSRPPRLDLFCPLLSLPLAFGATLETIPARVPYISVSAEKRTQWRTALGEHVGPRVGLAWSGSPNHKHDRNRSITLQLLRPLFSVAGIQFVSIQKNLAGHEREVLGRIPEIRHFGDTLNDFSDTAAIVDQLDLVITVDTAVAHLAGALARPVWVLLPFSPDWRWLLDRADSPWYPSMLLFRQARIGDWQTVIQKVKDRLGTFVAIRD